MATAIARHGSPFEPSPSPQPQPTLTKRDIRRNRIMEKLQGMIDSFSSNQHQHYRAQLQAVQADMTLILRANPYSTTFTESSSGVLEDGGEELRSLVESLGAPLPADEAAQRDYWALAGSRYKDFVRQVNDCVEQRDADLTALHNHYESSVDELNRLTQQKLHQAEEEHKALTNTIRQRLITSITKKRAQLLRDKEQLDIADSNALLLHPNHFSINNPASPPNGQNRKTRHLRHRAGSPNPGDLEPNGKKKRKFAAMEDDGNESPAPAFKPLPPPDALGGGRSPFKDAREKNVYTQYEAPAYSLERIFTEKELAMATDTAKLATWRYFHQPQSQQQQEQGSNSNGTNVPSVDGEPMDTTAEGEEGAVISTEGANGTPPPAQPAAADMERSVSHQVLTRGGARKDPLAALVDLATLAANERAAPTVGLATARDPFAPVVPSYHAVTRSEKSGAPAPSGVSHLDIDNDFAMMRQSASRTADGDPETLADADDEESARQIRQQLLDQALSHSGVSQPYRLPLLETGPAVIGKGVDRIPGTGFAPVMSVEQRSLIRQATQTGAPGAMAAALRAGGEPMSRTTSAGGASEVGNEPVTGRRGRGRQMV